VRRSLSLSQVRPAAWVRMPGLWVSVALGALTVWILLDPRIGFGYRAADARLITETAVAFVGVGVMGRSLWRYLESGAAIDGAIVLAFLALSFAHIGQGLVLPALGIDVSDRQEAAIYVWSLSRFAAFLILLGSIVYGAGRTTPSARRWQVMVIGGALVLLAGALSYGLFYAFDTEAPRLLTASGRAMLATGIDVRGAFLEVTRLQLVLQSALTGLVALTCILFFAVREPSDQRSDGFHRWVGISLIFAAFSQLHYVFYPSIYSPTITTGDLLRLAFYAILMMALSAEYLQYQRSMREVAVLEERARIARDIHDGVAQGLSFVLGSLAETVHDGIAPALRARVGRWMEILSDAQENLRDAITVLGPCCGGDPERMISAFCRDFSRRYGVEIDFQCVGHPGALPSPKDRELLLLLAEALHNLRKHGDSSRAVVLLQAQPRSLDLRVSGKGVGSPVPERGAGQAVDSTHYGGHSMAERARRLQGSLLITSDAAGEVSVQLMMPTSP
jgi:signal transduction histidine kinase